MRIRNVEYPDDPDAVHGQLPGNVIRRFSVWPYIQA